MTRLQKHSVARAQIKHGNVVVDPDTKGLGHSVLLLVCLLYPQPK